MWNRWQDPTTGRFLSEDPARDGNNWYAYVGNNPINRWDPTGLYLHITVNKDTQTMTVKASLPGTAGNPTVTLTRQVVTAVKSGDPSAAQDLRPERLQKNGANPTQFPNGTAKINGVGTPSSNKDQIYGATGLKTDATQTLPVKGGVVKDDGYFIHITPYANTNGCIGIPYDKNDPNSKADAEAFAAELVKLYKLTMEGDKDATITVTGSANYSGPTELDKKLSLSA